jgi:hypothetical protein
MNPDQEIKLNLALVNAILGYLGRQPYDQVVGLINEIQAQGKPQLPAAAKPPAQAPAGDQ